MTGLRAEFQVTSAVLSYEYMLPTKYGPIPQVTGNEALAASYGIVWTADTITMAQVNNPSDPNPNGGHIIAGTTLAQVKLVISHPADFAQFGVGDDFYLDISSAASGEVNPGAYRDTLDYVSHPTNTENFTAFNTTPNSVSLLTNDVGVPPLLGLNTYYNFDFTPV